MTATTSTPNHAAMLKFYMANKRDVDPSYGTPHYFTRAMVSRGITGTVGNDGRYAFTEHDVRRFIGSFERERQRKQALQHVGDPVHGVSPEYIMYLRGA